MVCPPWPSWSCRPQGESCILAQNITEEQVPLVAREYLNDAISNHDWKMFRNRLIDLVGDATFVYAALQTARYHRGTGVPQSNHTAPLHSSAELLPTGVTSSSPTFSTL